MKKTNDVNLGTVTHIPNKKVKNRINKIKKR